MWILGIGTGFSHDAAAALIRDGRLVMAVEEERLDRVKYGRGFPTKAIEACLQQAGIGLKDVDAVALNFQPWRMFWFDLGFNLASLFRRRAFRYAAFNCGWAMYPLLSTLREAERIARATQHLVRPQFIDHHLCHAASSFYVSPFEEAAILTIDNRGEAVSSTFGIGRGTRIERLDAIRYPDSLGMLYLGLTLFLGFQFGDEYKIMGLAAYGRPAYRKLMADLVRLEPRGRFSLNRSYFEYLGAEGVFSSKLYDALGPRRRAGEPLEQRHRDIACSLQERLEDVALHMAEHLHRATGLDNLCLSGGVAFNSVMNGALRKRSPFKRIFIQPAAGDAGTALGAALAVYHLQGDRPRSAVMDHALLGPSYDDERIEATLRACGVAYERPRDIAGTVATLLAEGRIVGWFQGRSEWGPRALGSRSILADPRRAEMKDRVNASVKHREDFRPFAPAVLEERASEYFEAGDPSPFMLVVTDVLEDRKGDIPAVTHVDGTARVQTVRRDTHALFWDLISAFDRLTGVPMVLNTSFNVNGEPMVCAPIDAIRCYFGSGLDDLAIGPFLVSKRTGPGSQEAMDATMATAVLPSHQTT